MLHSCSRRIRIPVRRILAPYGCDDLRHLRRGFLTAEINLPITRQNEKPHFGSERTVKRFQWIRLSIRKRTTYFLYTMTPSLPKTNVLTRDYHLQS